jgi:sucrase/ferredoxin-like protein
VSSPTRPDAAKPLCAETSRAHAESLRATASRVETWILIEYRGLWAHDAVDGSTLSGELKAFLVEERRRLPHARILFVRRNERRSRDGLLAYVARSTAGERGLRCLELERHDDLIGLDLGAAGEPVDHPLFLVCTHGKHDRCCAKFGRPLFDAVGEQVEDGWAWQSSHVGGDRFAGNLVVLADGVYYGRVEPAEAWPVVEAALERRVHLPLYRGRSCYGFAAQAAEIAVREATSLFGVDDVQVSSIAGDAGRWRAEVAAAGTAYEVDVHVEEGAPTHLTCSTSRLSRPRRFVAGIPRARAA